MTNLSNSQRWAYKKSGQIKNKYYTCFLRNITGAVHLRLLQVRQGKTTYYGALRNINSGPCLISTIPTSFCGKHSNPTPYPLQPPLLGSDL